MTPLVAAAEYGDERTVQLLLSRGEAGGRARYETSRDLQLMAAAVRGGNANVVRVCMDAGKLYTARKSGETNAR